MLRAAAWILGVLVVLGGSMWLYNHALLREVPTNGEVYVRPTPSDSSDTPAAKTPSQPAPKVQQQAAPAANNTPTTNQGPTPQAAMMANPTGAFPVSDTIPPNPPNGMVFAGSGKYQWYRQGNLTWRVNTETGTSCVAFATDEEWRKPRVYSHGCNA